MSGCTLTKVSITGFESCGFFKRAVDVSNKIAKAQSSVNVEVRGFVSREEYKAWLAQERNAISTKYGSAAASHTSSPFAVADDVFLGGCDALLAKLGTAFPDIDLTPPKVVVPQAPGFLAHTAGFAVDTLKVSMVVSVVSVVGRIGPLKRFLLKQMESKMHEAKVVSSYDEGKLMENVFNKPCTFGAFIWSFMRTARLSAQVAMGGLAPNVKLLDTVSGGEKLLYDYQHGSRLLVLNFGSQS
ncbi:unnamed protein product [Polarella glacialis]|uniref:Uncharacterized protein n=1 Tax=Polarella glacialis TaxID=89957 RepID=A0A813FUA7_POLGL|nr:unnamed protein product [Polarella glacialis]